MNFITTQKPQLLVAAVAVATVLSAASAFAQDALPEQFKALSAVSSTSRVEVIADAKAFRSQPNPWSREFRQVVVSPVSRATIKAETLRAIQAHEVVNSGEFFSIGPVQRSQIVAASR